jgi:hypothetical protein
LSWSLIIYRAIGEKLFCQLWFEAANIVVMTIESELQLWGSQNTSRDVDWLAPAVWIFSHTSTPHVPPIESAY